MQVYTPVVYHLNYSKIQSIVTGTFTDLNKALTSLVSTILDEKLICYNGRKNINEDEFRRMLIDGVKDEETLLKLCKKYGEESYYSEDDTIYNIYDEIRGWNFKINKHILTI